MDPLNLIADFTWSTVSRISDIPGTFWGVLAGSFFTLIGISRTNRAAANRQRDQLEHTMRKDVYLAAAENISATTFSFGRFVDPKVPFDELSKIFQERFPPVARIQLLAKPEFLRQMRRLEFEITAAFQRLVIERLPVAQLQQRIDILTVDNDRALKGQDEMLEEMKRFNLAGGGDQTKWNTIAAGFSYESKRVTSNNAKIMKLRTELSTRQMAFSKRLAQATQEIGRISAHAVIAARKELGTPIDGPEFLQMLEENFAKQTAELERFAAGIREAMEREKYANMPPEFQLGSTSFSVPLRGLVPDDWWTPLMTAPARTTPHVLAPAGPAAGWRP